MVPGGDQKIPYTDGRLRFVVVKASGASMIQKRYFIYNLYSMVGSRKLSRTKVS